MIVLDEFLDFLNYDPLPEVIYPIVRDNNEEIVYGIRVYKSRDSTKASLVFFCNSNSPKTTLSVYINAVVNHKQKINQHLKLRSKKGVHRYICQQIQRRYKISTSFDKHIKHDKRSLVLSNLCSFMDATYRNMINPLIWWCVHLAKNNEIPTADELHTIKTAYLFKKMDVDQEPEQMPF